MNERYVILVQGIVWLIVFAFAAMYMASVILKSEPIIYEAEPEEVSHGTIPRETIPEPDALDLWIEELMVLECNGCEETTKVLDVNNRYSYGCLQYQEQTWVWFSQELYGPDFDDPMAAIYDCEKQKEVTRHIITTYPEGWSHWRTSVISKGLGLPPTNY